MAGSNRGFLVLHDKPRYAEALAKLAERVRNELTFAGEVKVMVVRETRAVRYTGPTHRSRPSRGNAPGRSRSPRRPAANGGPRNGSGRNGDRDGH